MVRLLISAVLFAAAISLPVESIAGSLESPHVGSGATVERVGRSSPTGSTAPGEVIRAGAEDDGEGSSLPGDVRAVSGGAASRGLGGDRFLPNLEVPAARSILASGTNSARAPPPSA